MKKFDFLIKSTAINSYSIFLFYHLQFFYTYIELIQISKKFTSNIIISLFIMKKSTLQNTFLSKLSRNEITIEEALIDESTVIGVRRQSKIIIPFIIQNISSILRIAVDINSQFKHLSSKAMKIITTTNSGKLISAICDGKELNSIAKEIEMMDINDDLENHTHFTDDNRKTESSSNFEEKSEFLFDENINYSTCYNNRKNAIIGRFAEIVEACILKYPESIYGFHFLMKFLKYSDNYTIFSLFENLASSKKEEIVSFLKFVKFQDRIIDIISKWHRGDDFISSDCAAALYQILIVFVDTSAIYQTSFSPKLIQFSLDYFEHADSDVLAKQWKLAKTLVDASTVNDFATLYQTASISIEIISDTIFEYQINAIDFIISLITFSSPSLFQRASSNQHKFSDDDENYQPIETKEFDENQQNDFLSSIDSDNLFSCATKIFESFPNSSIALATICDLMLTSIMTEELRNNVIEIFFPVIIEGCQSQTVSQRAFSIQFVKQVFDMCRNSNKSLQDEIEKHPYFIEIGMPIVFANDSILHREYGEIIGISSIIGCSTLETLNPIPKAFNVSV
ncbi:hypothetical protein TRFO_14254 [Tritrichomonas foetus]|uniref:Uncharacterized protein n=1 Tax=Tritrichomonas foetus TaxID=1144522 RepID=A0A1J4KVG6_9EUKA|nr:hypothetical protein TRFO_14254 [Tritrichomonas foetus]|eukprot:OHT15231.1 hypothetical protein TRFO_14254 [Tritrichomonas foetus]